MFLGHQGPTCRHIPDPGPGMSWTKTSWRYLSLLLLRGNGLDVPRFGFSTSRDQKDFVQENLGLIFGSPRTDTLMGCSSTCQILKVRCSKLEPFQNMEIEHFSEHHFPLMYVLLPLIVCPLKLLQGVYARQPSNCTTQPATANFHLCLLLHRHRMENQDVRACMQSQATCWLKVGQIWPSVG